jgi:hypothetical protein
MYCPKCGTNIGVGPARFCPECGAAIEEAPPPPPSTPNYSQQQTPPPYSPPDPNAAMTTKEWIVVLLLLAIPLVNIILLFIWAFDNGGGTKLSKKFFARAYLIWTAIVIGLEILLMICMIALGIGLGEAFSDYFDNSYSYSNYDYY